jgi:hypothetical protein
MTIRSARIPFATMRMERTADTMRSEDARIEPRKMRCDKRLESFPPGRKRVKRGRSHPQREDPGGMCTPGSSWLTWWRWVPRDRVTPASATRLRGHPLRDRHLHQAASTTHWITSYQACRVRRVPTRPAPESRPDSRGRRDAPLQGTRGPWPNITAVSKHVSPFFSPNAIFFFLRAGRIPGCCRPGRPARRILKGRRIR